MLENSLFSLFLVEALKSFVLYLRPRSDGSRGGEGNDGNNRGLSLRGSVRNLWDPDKREKERVT